MNETLLNVADALEALSKHVMNSWSEDRTLKEAFGWNHPAITRRDLSRVASDLADSIKRSEIEKISPELEKELEATPKKLQSMHADTVPYMFNGNGANAVPAYLLTLETLNHTLTPLFYWKSITDQKQMPASLARRLNSINARLEEIEPQTSKLESQISAIREANEAAESLPTDLQSLRRARDDVVKIGIEAAEHLGNIKNSDKESSATKTMLKNLEAEASEIVAKCEDVYKTTTTQGLAASFDNRAKELGRSVWIWVTGLLIALVTGACLGTGRVKLLTEALKGDNPQWGVIVIHIVLSILSVGAPLWFAWLATKQIGQRFRLSEDYAFKASVAKAYEGYRREAARIDPDLEQRLFSSALTRLEEAPLRLVEEDSHGSPWHELVRSPSFMEAIDKVPNLKNKYMPIVTNTPFTSSQEKQQKTTDERTE